MRILLLTQNFPPETGAVANRLFDLATRMARKGAQITVLAPLPSYPFMQVFEAYRGKWLVRERIGGLDTVRSYVFTRKTKSIALRVLIYLSFVCSSLVASLGIKGRFDYVFLDAPPLFLGISAYVIKLMKRSRLVVNMSDLWPESAEKLGLVRNKVLLRSATALEEFLYGKADLITGQTQGIVENISGRFPEKPVLWLKNGVDLDLYDYENVNSSWRQSHGYTADDFIVLFAGLIGHAQGCEVIVRAASELAQISEIKFCLVGDGPQKSHCLRLARELDLQRVRFFDVQPRSQMPPIIAAANASVIPLKKLDLFKAAIPSKIFEHLAMRTPILLGIDGEAKELFVDQAEAGLHYEPENPIDLAAQIATLHADRALGQRLGENGHAFVREQFNREKIADELWEFMRAGLQDRRSGSYLNRQENP